MASVSTISRHPFDHQTTPPREALSASELARNQREIDRIARRLQVSPAVVALRYGDVYAELKARAVVADFLPVFATRKVLASF